MNVRKPMGVLLALAVAATGGCGAVEVAANETAAPKAPVAPTPKEQLLKALPGADTGAFHFAFKGGQAMEGVLDAAAKSYQLEVKEKDPDLGFTLSMKFLTVQEKTWIKITFSGTEGLSGIPKLPRKWMLLDPEKLKDATTLPSYGGETDPGELKALFDASDDVRLTGPGKYAGTTDLAEQGAAELVDQQTVDALGAKAAGVPFEAVVDAKGRLTRAVFKVPGAGKIKAERYEAVYSGYGTTEAQGEPAAGEQQKATATAYEMLNG